MSKRNTSERIADLDLKHQVIDSGMSVPTHCSLCKSSHWARSAPETCCMNTLISGTLNMAGCSVQWSSRPSHCTQSVWQSGCLSSGCWLGTSTHQWLVASWSLPRCGQFAPQWYQWEAEPLLRHTRKKQVIIRHKTSQRLKLQTKWPSVYW